MWCDDDDDADADGIFKASDQQIIITFGWGCFYIEKMLSFFFHKNSFVSEDGQEELR